MRAKAVLIAAPGSAVRGEVEFEDAEPPLLRARFAISGLRPGRHGAHIHDSDLQRHGDPCSVSCKHYNPTGDVHGSATSAHRHRGDLGNVVADADGNCEQEVLAECSVAEVIDKILVIHADADDLGLGNTPASLETGNSGAKVACGFIRPIRWWPRSLAPWR